MSFEYELPASVSVEKLIGLLTEKVDIRLISRHYSLKTFYDSFDWRLWHAGLVLEFNRSKKASTLTLKKIQSGRLVASNEITEVPAFPDRFTPGILRNSLQSLLDTRALLAISTLDYEAYQLNLCNDDGKVVLRLRIEDYEQCPARLILQPLKGYEPEAHQFTELLGRLLDLKPCDKTFLQIALKLQGRKPGDYSSKIRMDIDPETNAEEALKTVFSRLLAIIKMNESGTIADTDSEFLHDYRVSVRRTRTGLTQLKGILPDDVTEHYSDFFAWLNQVTCPTRDLDVYLLTFGRYRENLPDDMREHLDPLRDFLLLKKRAAHQEMVKKLRSSRYRTTLLAWEEYLKRQQSSPASHLSIKELADQRILKVYRRLLKQGRAITGESPAEDLHTLRKTCKKLRYLMEFFHCFYPDRAFKQCLKALKELQNVLGNFQDFHVQEGTLKQYGEELMAAGTPANTLLAMGILIEKLDERKCEARTGFSSSFEHFDRKKNHALFTALCSAKY